MNGERTATTRNDLISDFLGFRLAAAEIDGNRVSRAAREPGDRRANAAAGAGDDERAFCFGSCLSVQENLSITKDTKEDSNGTATPSPPPACHASSPPPPRTGVCAPRAARRLA